MAGKKGMKKTASKPAFKGAAPPFKKGGAKRGKAKY